jgi:hypothetical protein
MALAIIKYESSNAQNLLFRGDIGTNQFYVFVLGKMEGIRTEGGVPIIEEPYYTSDMQALREEAFGRFELDVSKHLIRENSVYIQLFSFKSEDGKSMAFSDIMLIKNKKNGRRKEAINLD